MSEETPVNQKEAHRAAQAEAKAAAARAKALRPWYKKKRFIFGLPLLAVVAMGVLGSLGESDAPAESSAARSGGGVSSQTSSASPQPRIGELISVGSLDLIIHTVEPVDASQYNMFNEANTRVRLTATNARGDADEEYNLSGFYFALVDSNGIAHDVALCAGCPDEISNVDLVNGGRVEGALYFNIPSNRSLVELLYEPLFSGNKVRIQLR